MSDDSYHVDLDPSALRMALDLQAHPEALGSLLSQLVEAAGGSAGVITTRADAKNPRTSCYGLGEMPPSLVTKMESAVAHLEEPEDTVSQEVLADLEREARQVGTGRPLAIPVHSGGRSVGLLCLWHNASLPTVLEDSPGLVHLQLDELEAGLRSARLLERLLHEKRWLEAVVQHTSDGVVIIDEKSRVVGYNLAMAKLSGRRMGDVVGEPYHEAFPLALEQEGASNSLLLSQDSHRLLHTTEPVEAKLFASTGNTVEVEICGAPLWDRQGKALGWVMTVRDITRRKEMDKLHKLFLSAVSHELQTPIAIIRGYAGLMADPEVELDVEGARSKASIILEESQRLEKMVQQMLYATKLQAQGVRLHQETIDVKQLMQRAAERLKPLMQRAGCKLKVEIDDKIPAVHADREALAQVVGNLLENATKYAPGHPVRLEAIRQSPRWVRIQVCDGGPGVPDEDRKQIFSPFARGGESLKSRVRGAGLGLYICKAIVDAHGGQIGVEGVPGGGACFYFTLPAEPENL